MLKFMRNPLTQLNSKLLFSNASNTEDLAIEYEGRIKTLPSRVSIEEYIAKFLTLKKQKDDSSKYNEKTDSFFWWYKTTKSQIKSLYSRGSSHSEQSRIIYSQNGWTNFHSYNDHSPIKAEKRVTLITSMFNCADWLPICLNNIIQQTFFSSCNLLLFDCERNPELLERSLPYLLAHENIKYFRLVKDPGLYGVWNMAAMISHTDYLGNMNTDDLRHPFQISELVHLLDHNSDCLVASTSLVPYQKEDIYNVANNGLMELSHTSLWSHGEEPWFAFLEGSYIVDKLFKFDENGKAVDSQCIPHCAPIWRRSIHDLVGFFNETYFSSAADWGLWLNCLANGGSAHISGLPYTYYYLNPTSYMRRDTKGVDVVNNLCKAYNCGQLSSFLNESLLLSPHEDPKLLIDLALNI